MSSGAATIDPGPGNSPPGPDGELGFAGNVAEVALPVVLQLIGAGRKTGWLTLSRRDGYGRLLFRDGRIIYASSPSYRTSFGAILVERGLVSDEELFSALELQNHCMDDQPLADILVERGVLDPREIGSVVQERIGSVLADVLGWDSCFFRFDGDDAPEKRLELEGRDFVARQGLRLDGGTLPPTAKADLGIGEGALAESPQMDRRSEILDTLLRFASTIVRRGVLFEVWPDRLIEVQRFDGDRGETRAPLLELPLTEPSLFTDPIHSGECYRGPLESSPGNERLLAALGGGRPSEAVAVPLAVEQRVEMIFYGDNGESGAALGAVEPLLMVLREGARELSSSDLSV